MLHQSRRDSIVWLTLDNPERLNAFTASGYQDLAAGIHQAVADAAIRAIVLTGRGRAFSAGADRSLIDGTASPATRSEAGIQFRAMLDAVDNCDKPILAAVNGLAVGIGCTILLHCDLVLLAESARLRFPFTALGMVPEAGSSALLPARASWGDSIWSMLSSEWIEAPAALRMGLAWRVVADADLVDETERAASILTRLDPHAVAATKRLLTEGRAAVIRAGVDREQAAMAALLDRKRPSASPPRPASPDNR